MTIFSGLKQASAAERGAELGAASSDAAANLTRLTAQEGIAEQRRQYDQSREDQMPWLTSGREALGVLDRTAAGDMSAFQASPDYNFRRTEGTRDIGSSFAARGGAASGNALRALSEFNSNLASGEFGQWWNRTASRAGVGQAAAGNLGQLGANTAGNIGALGQNAASNIGNLMQQGANARASGLRGQADAYANTSANTTKLFSYFYGMGG